MESRTVLYKTNIIGISGPAAGEGEEYLEIRYSVADNENPGRNKTESIMISPPYVFQNDRVYMQYDFCEWRWLGNVAGYEEIIRHDYKEGGAEYLQIINHAEGQAAPGKPRTAGVGRQQMGCAIALKPGTKVIDITKNPGYTVVIHKNPFPFPV